MPLPRAERSIVVSPISAVLCIRDCRDVRYVSVEWKGCAHARGTMHASPVLALSLSPSKSRD